MGRDRNIGGCVKRSVAVLAGIILQTALLVAFFFGIGFAPTESAPFPLLRFGPTWAQSWAILATAMTISFTMALLLILSSYLLRVSPPANQNAEGWIVAWSDRAVDIYAIGMLLAGAGFCANLVVSPIAPRSLSIHRLLLGFMSAALVACCYPSVMRLMSKREAPGNGKAVEAPGSRTDNWLPGQP
jgi:hypothetical protein